MVYVKNKYLSYFAIDVDINIHRLVGCTIFENKNELYLDLEQCLELSYDDLYDSEFVITELEDGKTYCFDSRGFSSEPLDDIEMYISEFEM